MSLLPFWALNMVVVLLSMEGQKALGFHQGLSGLEQYEGEELMTEFSVLGKLTL